MQCFWKSWCKMSPQLILNDVRSTFYLLVTNWNGACFQSNLMRLRKIIVICSVELFWSHSLRFLLTQSFDLYCLLFVCARFISFLCALKLNVLFFPFNLFTIYGIRFFWNCILFINWKLNVYVKTTPFSDFFK